MALDRDLKTLVIDRVDRSRVGRPSAILRVRLAITVLVLALGVIWWVWAGGTKASGMLYNPGHVTKAHAMFENDCIKCHAGDGKGGFSKAISDAACIKCHDGSIHHPNQLVADSQGKVSHANLLLAINDPTRPPGNPTRSADCASCHTEHRGEVALRGADDSHCVLCHAQLQKASTKPPVAAPSVVAFNLKNHPAFGRALTRPDPVDGKPRLFDPTVLKFDHRKHLTLEQFKDPNSCISCHATQPQSPAPSASGMPPFATAVADSHAAQPQAPGDGKYMLPVRFDQHCIGCHQLELPNTVATVEVTADGEKENKPVTPAIANVILRHRNLTEVRDQIAAQIGEKLTLADDAFKIPEADDTADAIKKLPVRQKWVRLNMTAMADDITTAIGRRSLAATFDPAGLKLPDTPTEAQLTGKTLADFYATQAVFSGKNACIACHEATGTLPTIPPADATTAAAPTTPAADAKDSTDAKPAAEAAAAAPAAATSQPSPLMTVPTGTPDGPRKWFTASVFDHSRHTQMSCVECHSTFSKPNLDRIAAIPDAAQQAAELRTVTDTSFVNSPNSTWSEWVSTNGQITSKTRSCVECHHADDRTSRGAGDACITCHQFHDRSKELRPAQSIAGR